MVSKINSFEHMRKGTSASSSEVLSDTQYGDDQREVKAFVPKNRLSWKTLTNAKKNKSWAIVQI